MKVSFDCFFVVFIYENPIFLALKYTQKMRDIIIRSQAHFYIEGDPIKTNLVAQNLEKRANELEKCYKFVIFTIFLLYFNYFLVILKN